MSFSQSIHPSGMTTDAPPKYRNIGHFRVPASYHLPDGALHYVVTITATVYEISSCVGFNINYLSYTHVLRIKVELIDSYFTYLQYILTFKIN